MLKVRDSARRRMGMGKELTRTGNAGLHKALPALYAPTARAAKRFIEYFAANIRNPNTRRAYLHAVLEFSAWCGRAEPHGDPRY
jgi:hypothetical protein